MPSHSKNTKFFLPVFLTCILSGTLDALAAMTQYMIRTEGGNPLKVWRYVASAVFGKKVFEMNLAKAAAWGLLFHFFIAFCFALFFFWVYNKMKILSKNIFLTAILYGAFVWIVMNRIVVPLSQAARIPFDLLQAGIAMAILIMAIGLPNAVMARKYYSGK
jgi:hypothetical protein